MAVLRHDMECIAAIHCLKVYCQRLGCDLSDGAAVRRAAGCSFALATEALSDMAILQFPPSLTAAAILVAARRAQASCNHTLIASSPHVLPYAMSANILRSFMFSHLILLVLLGYSGVRACLPSRVHARSLAAARLTVSSNAGLCALLAICAVSVDWVHRGEQPAISFSHRSRRPPLQQAVHLC